MICLTDIRRTSSVVRKEKETEEIVEDIGCAMSMNKKFRRWQVAILLWPVSSL